MKTAVKLLSLLFAILLMTSLSSGPVLAQGTSSSVTGGLSGAVTDATGAVVPGAMVTLVGPQGTYKLTTNDLGRFSASGLTPGYYDVTVEKPGFKKVEAKHSEVVVNSSSTLNLTLSTGNVETTVEVSSTAAEIDTTQTAVTTNLTDAFYNSVPMPRNVSAIFYAAPGVAAGQVAGVANQVGPGSSNPSIGGASALENLYVVDGVTITDQAFGSIGTYNRYHGALGTGINLAFIKEVDVKTTAFEPQFGKSTGGIVQIVTKSGGNQYHGALGAYFQPSFFYANRYQYYQFGYKLITPSQTTASPAYDAALEFGGYIPHFKDKLFFFGAFDPSLNENYELANPFAPAASVALGRVDYNTTALSYAGKLTYKLNDRTTIEATAFGDPSKRNNAPIITLSSAAPATTASAFNYGSRDQLARLDSAITSTWTVDLSYTYNHNHFTEIPAFNNYGITDATQQFLSPPGASIVYNLGPYDQSKNNTYSIAAGTSKVVQLFGQHTLSVGYSYDHTNFHVEPTRSGALYPIPATNYLGASIASLYTVPKGAIGSLTNAQFSIAAANSKNLTDPTCTKCPIINGVKAYASVTRGQYGGLVVNSVSRYHSAYGEDVWEMNRHVTIDAGVRWEQQRVASVLQNYSFGGNWSPRIGINIDPTGDHKSKLFFNFGRNFWALPLDAANRQLGNELDDTSWAFAPVVAADGTITIVPDSAHLLNGTPKSSATSGGVTTVSNFGGPSFTSSAEGIISGTHGEYEDEYVIGFERNLSNSLVVKTRYTDRRLGRIIEDVGTYSPEGSEVDAGAAGGIANPSPGLDVGVNENEVTYTPAQFLAKNPGTVTKANYVAPVAGCTYANDTYNAIGTFFADSLNVQVGGACILNASVAATTPKDGIPDGFVKPVRRYNAVEIEMDKRFNNHWLAIVNFKWGNLFGNYEGAYRNDNGQADPGISSLFDFTAGKLNLLGAQFAPGSLSSDRRTVGNIFLSYTVGSDTRFFSGAKGLTVGLGARGQSGVPLSLLGDHPIYLNQGEVPVGGRGAGGRTPATDQLDLHVDYALPLGSHFAERYRLKLALDTFNVTNSQFQTGRVQYTQATNSGGVGAPPPLNVDYNRPTSFQQPFNARGSIRFEF
jgi:hypothetical protein